MLFRNVVHEASTTLHKLRLDCSTADSLFFWGAGTRELRGPWSLICSLQCVSLLSRFEELRFRVVQRVSWARQEHHLGGTACGPSASPSCPRFPGL